jgi:ketosteroid isomerase-like protein
MRAALVGAGLAMALLAPAARGLVVQQQQAIATVRQFQQAFVGGQSDALTQLVAPDFTARLPEGSQQPIHDLAALRAAQDDAVLHGERITVHEFTVAGGRVAWSYSRSCTNSRAGDIPPVEGIAEAVVRDGRIVQVAYHEDPAAVAQHDSAVQAALAGAAAACGGHPACTAGVAS